MIAAPRATVKDLYNVPENGKAELVGGELRIIGPTGLLPGYAGGKIVFSLMRHEEDFGGGYAIPDNVGFVVDLPNRGSFSPDAAWYVGDIETMKFANAAPRFAVEVRSENDYEPAAEQAIMQKIRDYVAAGTLVVWDVDLQSENVIKKYSAGQMDAPTIYKRGDMADAEPGVTGWRFPVANLFR